MHPRQKEKRETRHFFKITGNYDSACSHWFPSFVNIIDHYDLQIQKSGHVSKTNSKTTWAYVRSSASNRDQIIGPI
jgi:hypothetical protein